MSTTPPDLTPIFPPDKAGNPQYVPRYRPGSQTLISKDADGKPLKAVLEFAMAGEKDWQLGHQVSPGVADTKVNPTTRWHQIAHGWQLLEDRLGIEITIENPDDWGTGENKRDDGKGVPETQLSEPSTWPSTVPTPTTRTRSSFA